MVKKKTSAQTKTKTKIKVKQQKPKTKLKKQRKTTLTKPQKKSKVQEPMQKIGPVILNSNNLAKINCTSKFLSKEETDKLILLYQKTKNEDAINRLIESNIALVKNIVNSYLSTNKSYANLYDDALTEGTLGLIEAINKFKISKGCRLSTYATWYIRLKVGRFLDNSAAAIKVPINQLVKIRRILKKSGIEGLSEDQRRIYENTTILSLDYPTSSQTDDSQKSFIDYLPIEQFNNPEEVSNQNSCAEEILEVINTLSPKEAYVVKNYFGIKANPRTLNVIADELGLTHQRISQILIEAMKKLKRPPRSEKFLQIASNYGVAGEIFLSNETDKLEKLTAERYKVKPKGKKKSS